MVDLFTSRSALQMSQILRAVYYAASKNFIDLSSHCCAMDLLPWEEFRTQKISPSGRDDKWLLKHKME